jgi:hypothetical protein
MNMPASTRWRCCARSTTPSRRATSSPAARPSRSSLSSACCSRSERTATRKIKEAILAAEITRRYSKDDILELYLNEVYYGNLAYGIDAAAETYFGKEVGDLTLAEAALLAGLPQLPAYYDPYTHPDRAKNRAGVVLGLMVEAGYITAEQANAAWAEPLAYAPLQFDLNSPHFTLYVRQQLEQLFGPEALYQSGYSVTHDARPAPCRRRPSALSPSRWAPWPTATSPTARWWRCARRAARSSRSSAAPTSTTWRSTAR